MKIKFDMEIDDKIIDMAIERARENGGLVAVVRCKDCEHHEDEEPEMVYCPYFVGGWVSNDFFCGKGTRCDMMRKGESDGRSNQQESGD